MTVDIDRLRQWIGRKEHLADCATAWPQAALAATLDRDEPFPRPDAEVPPGGHWLYFLTAARMSEVGPDGHARRGGFLPPVPLPRRMWAGGRLEFLKPLRIGETLHRVSEIRDVSFKQGRSGDLVFVVVRHEISGEDGLAVREEHDIVYRAAPAPGAPAARPARAPEGAQWRREVVPDAVMLFRYSALTFNGHRIHYDHPYATATEGYSGLVVHGPLIATLLMDLVRRECGDLRLAQFDFRAVGPMFDGAPLILEGRPAAGRQAIELWARAADGGLAMTADATLTPRAAAR